MASVNITNLEDSEAMIRAYKKKKAELEEVKDKFYKLETDFFTERQRAILLEEENHQIKLGLARTEKALKDLQIRESRKDSDLLSK